MTKSWASKTHKQTKNKLPYARLFTNTTVDSYIRLLNASAAFISGNDSQKCGED